MDSPSFIYCNDPTDYGIGETIYAYVHFKRDLKSPSLHYLNYAKEMCLQRISAVNVKLCCFTTNCIVGIKPLKILLPVYPHSTAFKNVIALYYLIILKPTNVE